MRTRHLKTQQNIYVDHLTALKQNYFDHKILNPEKETIKLKDLELPIETNFGFTVTNQFAFLLLHLRNKSFKNIINIKIPDTCIFVDQTPYDIIYSQSGYIRGFRKQENSKIRLRQMYSFFKNKWGSKKDQPCYACFQNEEYLLLSDTDLFITSRKFKNDPFFSKLRYIRNKLDVMDQQIKINFYVDSNEQQDIKVATESLLGFKDESLIAKMYDEEKYLKFCSEKIALYLNYQHNIRIISASFYFSKSANGDYYLMNVLNLKHTNLTAALINREKRLRLIQEERNKILIMSQQKELKYKNYQKNIGVEVIQHQMDKHFLEMAKKLKIVLNQDRIREEQKTKEAFHKLFPRYKKNYHKIFTASNFSKTRNQIFETDGRKPLTKISRCVMKFYNMTGQSRLFNSRIRSKTQSFAILQSERFN